MKFHARGGTDGAIVVLFWPANMPDDADQLLQTKPISLIESLHGQGKLIWFPCDADGAYALAIFVRCPIPDELFMYCRNEELISALIVKGEGYFGGGEYMCKDAFALLKRYPTMCEKVFISEGTYSARVYCTDVPESIYESWLIDHAGARAKRLWDLHGTIAALAVVSVIGSLLAFATASWMIRIIIWTIAFTLVGAAVGMSRTKWYKKVARAQDTFRKSYPDYVIHLN
jgi:hypothetical protein